MCGRKYSTYSEEELHLRYLNHRQIELGLMPNFNFCPTQSGPVVRMVDGELRIDIFRWGLVPSWAKDEKAGGYSLINAKAEEITEKRTYKEPFQKRRCVVPISGFIEWRSEPSGKRPFSIFLKTQPIMSLAGIWEFWERDGKSVHSYSVITTAANSFMADIHTRMPVILSREDESRWLDPQAEVRELQNLLKSSRSENMRAIEISRLVNSPKNNSPEVLLPVDASEMRRN